MGLLEPSSHTSVAPSSVYRTFVTSIAIVVLYSGCTNGVVGSSKSSSIAAMSGKLDSVRRLLRVGGRLEHAALVFIG